MKKNGTDRGLPLDRNGKLPSKPKDTHFDITVDAFKGGVTSHRVDNIASLDAQQEMVKDKVCPNFGSSETQSVIYFLSKLQSCNTLRIEKLKSIKHQDSSVESKSDSENADTKTIDQDEIIEGLKKKAKPGEKTKGKSTQYELEGGYEAAVKDFESLEPSRIRDEPELKVGTLKDGRKINVRIKSTNDNRPTLEIQERKNKRIKFRYND